MRPAWSWQFDPRVLKPVSALDLPARITPEWAWAGADGAGVRVAVVDSGVESGHPDVGEVPGGVALTMNAAGELSVDEGPHDDLFGHGTACAGIIRRLAPRCEIHSVRVLGANLTGHEEAFAAGLRWAIDQRFDVVNLSLGTATRNYFPVFHELADRAYFNRVVLVAAMSNVTGPSYPGEYAAVLSVAAHDGKDPFSFMCNPRPPVEFGAPGIDVEVAWKGGGHIRATGNSFAAPHIAGLVTLILSKHPGLTPFEVKAILRSTAANAA